MYSDNSDLSDYSDNINVGGKIVKWYLLIEHVFPKLNKGETYATLDKKSIALTKFEFRYNRQHFVEWEKLRFLHDQELRRSCTSIPKIREVSVPFS